MAQLAGEHDNLSAVMGFVGDEIGENVANVEGKVAPHISRCRGNGSTVSAAEFQETQNADAATLQSWNKIFRSYFVAIDTARDCDAVFFAERLDPHTPGIVEVTGKHPDGATWGSGDRGLPEFRGQMLDQKDSDAIIGFPRVKDRIWSHAKHRAAHLRS
jgi:hypothetical protein